VDPGGKVRIVTVSTGETVGNMRVVSGPLEPGDRIVVEGIQKAREGVLVNPKPWDGGTNVTASSSAAANRD
jgi:multidrug efflux pump subunit AcrA (membrane-fusion protein)